MPLFPWKQKEFKLTLEGVYSLSPDSHPSPQGHQQILRLPQDPLQGRSSRNKPSQPAPPSSCPQRGLWS